VNEMKIIHNDTALLLKVIYMHKSAVQVNIGYII